MVLQYRGHCRENQMGIDTRGKDIYSSVHVYVTLKSLILIVRQSNTVHIKEMGQSGI